MVMWWCVRENMNNHKGDEWKGDQGDWADLSNCSLCSACSMMWDLEICLQRRPASGNRSRAFRVHADVIREDASFQSARVRSWPDRNIPVTFQTLHAIQSYIKTSVNSKHSSAIKRLGHEKRTYNVSSFLYELMSTKNPGGSKTQTNSTQLPFQLGSTLLRSFKPSHRKKKHRSVGLASDDVTKLSNAWQQQKLVRNKGSVTYKSMLGEKSLTWQSFFFSFVERSARFWQLFHSLVRHISKDSGDRTSAGPFFRSIDDLPACFCMGRYLCLEPILPVATQAAGLWHSTCKPSQWSRLRG